MGSVSRIKAVHLANSKSSEFKIYCCTCFSQKWTSKRSPNPKKHFSTDKLAAAIRSAWVSKRMTPNLQSYMSQNLISTQSPVSLWHALKPHNLAATRGISSCGKVMHSRTASRRCPRPPSRAKSMKTTKISPKLFRTKPRMRPKTGTSFNSSSQIIFCHLCSQPTTSPTKTHSHLGQSAPVIQWSRSPTHKRPAVKKILINSSSSRVQRPWRSSMSFAPPRGSWLQTIYHPVLRATEKNSI